MVLAAYVRRIKTPTVLSADGIKVHALALVEASTQVAYTAQAT
jgi:hypothetical protein